MADSNHTTERRQVSRREAGAAIGGAALALVTASTATSLEAAILTRSSPPSSVTGQAMRFTCNAWTGSTRSS